MLTKLVPKLTNQFQGIDQSHSLVLVKQQDGYCRPSDDWLKLSNYRSLPTFVSEDRPSDYISVWFRRSNSHFSVVLITVAARTVRVTSTPDPSDCY